MTSQQFYLLSDKNNYHGKIDMNNYFEGDEIALLKNGPAQNVFICLTAEAIRSVIDGGDPWKTKNLVLSAWHLYKVEIPNEAQTTVLPDGVLETNRVLIQSCFEVNEHSILYLI